MSGEERTSSVSQTSMEEGAVFTRGDLMHHVAVTSLTSSLGLMAIYAVDLIDLIFISMLGQKELAAAAGYASSLMFFTSAVCIGISIAAGALVSKSIGMRAVAEARDQATTVAVLSVLVSVVQPVLMLAYVDELLGLLGATGEVAEMAARYLWIVLPFTFVSGLSMVSVAAIRAHGDAKHGTYPALAGALTNGVLDPLFIFALGFGLEGAAMATVAARLVTLAFAAGYAIRLHRSFAPVRLMVLVQNAGAACAIGIPAILTNLATPVGTAIITREMARFGPDAVAGMAIVGRLVPVAFSVVIATSGAVGPIVGQNLGAGFLKRIRRTMDAGLLFIFLYVLVMSGILFLLRHSIADLFSATGQTRSLVLLFCGPLALAHYFNGAISVAGATFENLGHPLRSTLMNWGRSTLGTLPFVMIGAELFGAKGILIGQAAGGVVFAFLSVFLAMFMLYRPARRIRKHGFSREAMKHDLMYFGRG
ncbi:MAG: MATE family efflux transporter [Roseovarius sp.]|nr:MATE family efflux transporter [Roseovarius sp.]